MKRLWIIPVLFYLAAHQLPALAQSRTILINGKVISFEESLPLEGVSVVVKGTKNGTGTQADGTYTLSLAAADSVLVVSYPDYESQEIRVVRDKREYDVVLCRKENSLAVIPSQKYLYRTY